MVEIRETDSLAGKELLLDVALTLFMEHGYEGVSMQQIATAASMTKGSPYYHFKGKEDLFLQAFAASLNRTNAGFMAHLIASEPLRERLIASFTYILASIHPGMIRIMDDYQRLFSGRCDDAVPIDENPPDMMRRAYAEEFERSHISFRLPADALGELLISMQLGVMHARMHAKSREPKGSPENSFAIVNQDPEVVATLMVDLFLDGAISRD